MPVYPNGSKEPPPFTSSGAYGAPRPNGRIHAGTDYIGYGDLIATHDAVITHAGWMNNDAGNVIAYDLPIRTAGELITIVRMHAESITVKIGQSVKAGQKIGVMGDTGNAQGDCDHTEIRKWKNGFYDTIDPVSFFANEVQGGSTTGGESTNYNGEDEMNNYIAIVKGDWFLIQNVKGQPTGHLLGSASGARESGIPILEYKDDWAVEQLQKTTVLKR